MGLTDLHLGFRDERQRRRVAALVVDHLADEWARGGRLRYLRQAAALGHAPAGYALGYDAFMNGGHDAAAPRG